MHPTIESVRSPQAPHETAPLDIRSKPHKTWHRVLAGAVLLLLVLVVVPPFINISRFRRTIVRSISAGLGRPVEASGVELVLFPRPGFVLHNLTVGEDPAFGAEPVMMAETVTAGLRASTLWHARVEIATLRFDSPSVNLVRNAAGQWNFESLLRNSPALKPRGGLVSHSASRRLPFPYVEATDARINFKLGREKLPFSLERADLAIWKESRHEWRLRIKARPIRTDLTLMDAGQVRGQGTLMTGGPLTAAPIRASVEWRHVQLGEINRLLHGQDDSWRGTVNWTAHARGTLADVSVASDIAVEELRRAEFIPSTEMDFSAHCNARYARSNPQLNALACDAPIGDGHLLLHADGTFPRPVGELASVQIALHQIPAGFFLDLLGRVRSGISGDTAVSGIVNGEADCDWQTLAALTACTGRVQSPKLQLQLAHLDRLLISSPLLLASSAATPGVWTLSPIHLPFGAASPATVAGTMTIHGAALKVTGAADLAQLARLAQSLKFPAISGEVESIRGSAQLALSLKTPWLVHADAGTPPPLLPAASTPAQPAVPASPWSGSVQVRDATVKLAMFPVPLQLASAQIDLTSTGVQWNVLEGSFANIPFEGRIEWQTPCPTSHSACARTFRLHTPNLNLAHLQAALNNGQGESNLLKLINPWAGGVPQVPEISGTLNADVLSVGKISLKEANLNLGIHGQSADLFAISGKVFGGTLSGTVTDTPAPDSLNPPATGSLRWGNGAPAYALRLTLKKILPNRVGAIWHEAWGTGAGNLQIDLKTQGWSTADLTQNATGKFRAEWLNGSLSGLPSTSSQLALQNFQRWSAQGLIRNRTLVFASSQIVPQHTRWRNPSPAQSIAGTITFARTLDLRLDPGGPTLTGPLHTPVVQSPTATGNNRKVQIQP